MYSASMNIVIKTGFQAVTHHINFQKCTEPKGENLAKAGHIRDVEEYRTQSCSYFIKANVIRQVSVGNTPYIVKLWINAERVLTAVECNCVYNKSAKCKHIAGLIYFVNNHESLSKTSFEKQWGNPSARQFVKEKYAKGCSFAKMFPPPPKLYVAVPQLDISKLKDPSPLKNILLVKADDRREENARLEREQDMEAAENRKNCSQFMHIIIQLCEIHSTYGIDIHIEEELYNFYINTVVPASRDAIVKLCCDTLGQSTSDKWFEERRLRISASTNVHNIKARKTKSVESLVESMLYPKKVDTLAIRYGKRNEAKACKEYECLNNVQVQHFGLIVTEEQPWLCASPDGVVIKDNFIEKIVEFKCPFTCAKLPIIDPKSNECNVNYLTRNKDGAVILKESSVYYTQCQVQMYVTGTDIYDLFIYSPVQNGSYCVTIVRNDQFLSNVIRKSEQFYFEHYLKKLYYKMIEEPKKSKNCENENVHPKRTFNGCNIVNTI